MKVYTVYLSEDGLYYRYATNAKMLYEMIEDLRYEGMTNICYHDGQSKQWRDVKFNQANVLKALKASALNDKGERTLLSSFTINKGVDYYGHESIEIKELDKY